MDQNDLQRKKTTAELIPELLGGKCRYCDQPVVDAGNAAITYSYWSAFPFIAHPACKKAGERQEAFDCQVIDADCNDCIHFQRGKLVGEDIWSGQCLKFGIETRGCPNKWTGKECFEHRRAPTPPTSKPTT